MVLRKPYAFLIKNFRKIHIFILLLCIFIYFKVNSMTSFIKDYIQFGTYSASLESFSSKTGFLFYLAILLVIISSILLLILLRKKDKPWKIYLAYIGEYFFLLISVILVSRYFASYSIETSVSGVMIYKDMLNICKYLQYIIFFLLIIRIFGFDIKKFNFTSDKEYLELSNEDREEFEISFDLDVDRHSVKRVVNRLRRNIHYFYQEHKFISNIVICASVLIAAGYSYYYFGILHKAYKQGVGFDAGIYHITIKDSYVTDKDYTGNKIEKGNKFVILTIKIKNNYHKRVEPNLSRFHLMNGSYDKSFTTYYNTYFTDLGQPGDSKLSLNASGEREFYLVYKVKEELDNKRFVMYYQELGGKRGSYLRKIKLDMIDLSEIKDEGTYRVGDKLKFQYASSGKKEVLIDHIEFGNSFSYNRYYCTSDTNCFTHQEVVTSKNGKMVLKLAFTSSDFEGEDFIDFSRDYGRIKYIDNRGKVRYEDVVDAIGMDYQGREVYLSVSNEVANSNNAAIIYTFRNKRYTLKIK